MRTALLRRAARRVAVALGVAMATYSPCDSASAPGRRRLNGVGVARVFGETDSGAGVSEGAAGERAAARVCVRAVSRDAAGSDASGGAGCSVDGICRCGAAGRGEAAVGVRGSEACERPRIVRAMKRSLACGSARPWSCAAASVRAWAAAASWGTLAAVRRAKRVVTMAGGGRGAAAAAR